MRKAAVPMLLALTLAAPAWSQVPAGPDFGINAYTTNIQQRPSVAADAAGSFVVLWEGFGSQDGDLGGVFGRRYDASGLTLGPDYFQVNSYTTANQIFPSVAASANRIVAVWTSFGQDGSDRGIFGREFDAVSGAGGTEFAVNTYTTGRQWRPSVGLGAAGFIVVWESNQDGDGYGVFAQRYSAPGVADGPEFRVNSWTTGHQTRARVAMNAAGRFVVVWESAGQDGSGAGIFGQHYDAAGVALGSEFQVNAYTTDAQSYPSVAIGSDGDFVVVWDANQDGSAFGVLARQYDASGAPRGGEFRVNSLTVGDQRYPAVTSDASGAFVVVWQGPQPNALGTGADVFGRRYDALGAQGPDFLINSYSTDPQNFPSVASGGSGDFVAVWGGSGPHDLMPGGVFGRRFRADVIFRDGFETSTLDGWSARSADGGDLNASKSATHRAGPP